MTTHTETPPLDAQEKRWRQWQRRGQLQDRKSAIYARVVAAIAVSGSLGWLLFQIVTRP